MEAYILYFLREIRSLANYTSRFLSETRNIGKREVATARDKGGRS